MKTAFELFIPIIIIASIVIGVGLVLIMLYTLIVYPIRNKRLRKNPQAHDFVKFYIDEVKYRGKIIKVDIISVTVYYLCKNGLYKTREVHKSNLYATW